MLQLIHVDVPLKRWYFRINIVFKTKDWEKKWSNCVDIDMVCFTWFYGSPRNVTQLIHRWNFNVGYWTLPFQGLRELRTKQLLRGDATERRNSLLHKTECTMAAYRN